MLCPRSAPLHPGVNKKDTGSVFEQTDKTPMGGEGVHLPCTLHPIQGLAVLVLS